MELAFRVMQVVLLGNAVLTMDGVKRRAAVIASVAHATARTGEILMFPWRSLLFPELNAVRLRRNEAVSE